MAHQSQDSGPHPGYTPAQLQQARERREKKLAKLVRQKRIMLCLSVLAALFSLVWIVAVATDSWIFVDLSNANETETKFVRTGLYRSCIIGDIETKCKYHTFFPSKAEVKRMDEHVIDYTRTQITFSFLSLFLMIFSLIAALYTFKNARYIYKRLASGLFFVTSICTLVVIENLMTSLRYQQGHGYQGKVSSYGYSFYFGWTVFVVYFLNGCVFLGFSGKKKWGV